MSEDDDKVDAREEKTDPFLPNTLAWAARAYDQKRRPIAPPWRILPRTVPLGPIFEANALMDTPLPQPGMRAPNPKEKKR